MVRQLIGRYIGDFGANVKMSNESCELYSVRCTMSIEILMPRNFRYHIRPRKPALERPRVRQNARILFGKFSIPLLLFFLPTSTKPVGLGN